MDLRRFKKPLIQGALVLLFFVLLALWANWFFSLVVIGLMLAHEYGHIWAFKRNGIQIRGMYFVPFLGAIIIPSGSIKSRKEEDRALPSAFIRSICYDGRALKRSQS